MNTYETHAFYRIGANGKFTIVNTVQTYTVVANRIYESDAEETSTEFLLSYDTTVYMYSSIGDFPSILFDAYRDLLGSSWWLATPLILGQIIVFMPLYIYRHLWVVLGR